MLLTHAFESVRNRLERFDSALRSLQIHAEFPGHLPGDLSVFFVVPADKLHLSEPSAGLEIHDSGPEVMPFRFLPEGGRKDGQILWRLVAENPELGLSVFGHILVIVEMVRRDIEDGGHMRMKMRAGLQLEA